jgi:quercetin dioxygenase-like cupin family protein
MAAAQAVDLVPPAEGSELALALVRLEAGQVQPVSDVDADTLLHVLAGTGTLTLGRERQPLEPGTAALVLAGETATVDASTALTCLQVTVGAGADRHAPLGPRETIARLDDAGAEAATGARSFQILFGPNNGSTRATLFAGYIPPGKAPWHYHQYDEIVYVPDGPGRLHLEEGERNLDAGTAFRLRPRQVHIVENTSTDRELTIIGVFTPAGSPSAAYLTPVVAATYRFGGL